MNKGGSGFEAWFHLFIVGIIGLGSAIGIFSFFSGNSMFTKASGEQASLQFIPNSVSVQKNIPTKIQLMVDSDKASVRGVDIVITFDPTHVTLNRIIPTAQKFTELKTYLPIDSQHNFDNWKVVNKANTTGVIEFSAVTADVANNRLLNTINGNFVVAELEFILKKDGATKVEFRKSHPSLDSTVVRDSNPPMNILTKTNTLILSAETSSQ